MEFALFDLRQAFFLGNYQAAVAKGPSVKVANDAQRLERDLLLYRSFLAQGNFHVVLDEIKPSSDVSLQAVRLQAVYLSGDVAGALAALQEWSADASRAANPTFHVIAATILLNEGRPEDAWRAVYQSQTLEARSFLIQTYLRMFRGDLATQELALMQKEDEDAPLTQLCAALLVAALGADKPEKLREALGTFQELGERYSYTVTLLNGQAVCNMHLGQYEAAERNLLDALERNAKSAETLSNLICVYEHLHKPQELISRYISQLRTIAPNCEFSQSMKLFDESFERNAARHAPEVN